MINNKHVSCVFQISHRSLTKWMPIRMLYYINRLYHRTVCAVGLRYIETYTDLNLRLQAEERGRKPRRGVP